MPSRRFTEKQTAEILRTAAEIQLKRASHPSGEGVLDEELRSAARELGIDSDSLEEAIRTLDAPSVDPKPGLLGGPFHLETEAVLEGNVSDEAWEETVADLRRTFGENGDVQVRGSTREWTGTGGGLEEKTLTIRETAQSVRVTVAARIDGQCWMTYLVGLVPFFIGVVVAKKLEFPVIAAIGALLALGVVLTMAARSITIGTSRKRAKVLRGVVSRLETRVRQASPSSSVESRTAENKAHPSELKLTLGAEERRE